YLAEWRCRNEAVPGVVDNKVSRAAASVAGFDLGPRYIEDAEGRVVINGADNGVRPDLKPGPNAVIDHDPAVARNGGQGLWQAIGKDSVCLRVACKCIVSIDGHR